MSRGPSEALLLLLLFPAAVAALLFEPLEVAARRGDKAGVDCIAATADDRNVTVALLMCL